MLTISNLYLILCYVTYSQGGDSVLQEVYYHTNLEEAINLGNQWVSTENSVDEKFTFSLMKLVENGNTELIEN